MIRRASMWWRYLRGDTPWDTGITPSEVKALIESESVIPGRALDLGCGTGTNALYLADHGWSVVGIDFVSRPIRRAQHRAHQAGLADRVRFLTGDVTRLESMCLGCFDFVLDIGCGHGLMPGQRARYAAGIAASTNPGAILMLYMFRPSPERRIGLEADQVEALFAPAFRLVWADLGRDMAAQSASAWYRFERDGRD